VNLIDGVVAYFAPAAGKRRVQARMAIEALSHFRASTIPRRSGSVRAVAGDADAVATRSRREIALIARDMVRNNGLAARAVESLVNAIVGTGIEPKLVTADESLRSEWAAKRRMLDAGGIDPDTGLSLSAIQRLAVRAMITDGECLLVCHREPGPNGFMQVRLLEMDYLDDRMQGRAANPANAIYDGIEYGPDNRPVAYHIYDEHPGSAVWHPNWRGLVSKPVDASRVIHLYRADRPGQRRGISWLAPVLDDLVAIADNDEAQLLRQKIAACFAGFWRTERPASEAGIPSDLSPGLIQQIGMDDEVQFAEPPGVTGYDDFSRIHLRRIATGIGCTYEALTGDLSGVNFSSARIGRIEHAQSVEAWQWTLVIPKLCTPMGQWIREAWSYEPRADERGRAALLAALAAARIEHTPPPPVIADPKQETEVAIRKIEAGLSSRPSEIRKMGYEPAEIDAEIAGDAQIRRGLAELTRQSAPITERKERDLDV